jgi:hypothetical protein
MHYAITILRMQVIYLVYLKRNLIMSRYRAFVCLAKELNERNSTSYKVIDEFLDSQKGKEFISQPKHIKEILKELGF